MERFNAKITRTMLGIEDHGILTFIIDLEFNDGGQGLRGYALDGINNQTKKREGSAPGFVAIRHILETVGVACWENLPGTLCRVEKENGFDHNPPKLGHIIENRWFDLKQFMYREKDNVEKESSRASQV